MKKTYIVINMNIKVPRNFSFLNPWVLGNKVKINDAVMHHEGLALQPPNYSIIIFTHLKLCLADAIHNFKWVKIIQIRQDEGQ